MWRAAYMLDSHLTLVSLSLQVILIWKRKYYHKYKEIVEEKFMYKYYLFVFGYELTVEYALWTENVTNWSINSGFIYRELKSR